MADTIAAVSTLLGRSAIGILRMSGEEALAVAERVFRPDNGRPLGQQPTHKLVNGCFYGADGALLDQ